jgi:hypothetical protein
MTVKDVIDLVEMKLLRAGHKDTPRRLIRDVTRLKFKQFAGLGLAEDGRYTLTTDGSREYELPEAVHRVEFVIVDDYEALKSTPEEADRTYHENQSSS